MKYSNIAMIYQPHYHSNCFRAATLDQKGEGYNYIIVTCSPTYNGLWRYPANNRFNYSTWQNKRLSCYEVPISDCTWVKSLDKLPPDIIAEVKKQQTKWHKKEVEGMEGKIRKKPDWML